MWPVYTNNLLPYGFANIMIIFCPVVSLGGQLVGYTTPSLAVKRIVAATSHTAKAMQPGTQRGLANLAFK